MMESIANRPMVTTILLGIGLWLAYGISKLYQARMLVIRMKKSGLPVAPGHSFLFGHMLFLKSWIDKLPYKAHYFYAFGNIYEKYFKEGGVYYLDAWPVAGLMLVVISPTAATEAFQTNSLTSMKKPKLLARYFKPITGGASLFDMPEPEWRPWRTVFNKGFNVEHLTSLIPGMVQQTATYCETLRSLASKGNVVQLDPITLRFMLDMIGKTILNTDLGAQKGYNVLADSMLNQIKWHQPTAEYNPLEYINVLRWFNEWRNSRRMNLFIGDQLDKRYNEFKADSVGKRSRGVIDLVIQAYMSSEGQNKHTTTARLEPRFRAFAISQIRLFIFAGHDSTSGTICCCIYFLAHNPSALARIRDEHDRAFGKDLSTLPATLTKMPHLANDLPYTAAVIKEAMRFFPPASGMRDGHAGVSIRDDLGQQCPTDHAAIYSIHSVMQRASKYWTRPNEFLPERWLVDPGHELYPVKGAWRPFENGPRNCIAQGLVMMELKVVLAHMVREFDFHDAYDEWDILHPREGVKTYKGKRAYLIEDGASHLIDYFPCKISLREA